MSEVTLSVVLIIFVLFSLDCGLLVYTAAFNMKNGLTYWELVMLYSFIGKLYYVLVHNNVLCIILVMYKYVHDITIVTFSVSCLLHRLYIIH